MLLQPKGDCFFVLFIFRKYKFVYLQCHVCQTFYRKSDYLWFADICSIQKCRDAILRLGSRGSDVKYSTRAYFCMQGDRCDGSCTCVRTSHMRQTLTSVNVLASCLFDFIFLLSQSPTKPGMFLACCVQVYSVLKSLLSTFTRTLLLSNYEEDIK